MEFRGRRAPSLRFQCLQLTFDFVVWGNLALGLLPSKLCFKIVESSFDFSLGTVT